MSEEWTFAIAATSLVLSAVSFYGVAAQVNEWWPWTKWVSYRRYRVALGKEYVILRDPGESWLSFPYAVMHPHGGCVGVAMTRWGARRILERATGRRWPDA